MFNIPQKEKPCKGKILHGHSEYTLEKSIMNKNYIFSNLIISQKEKPCKFKLQDSKIK